MKGFVSCSNITVREEGGKVIKRLRITPDEVSIDFTIETGVGVGVEVWTMYENHKS